ncbi:MAG: hypothetical protein U1C74_01985 [Phenylobacterium sp.]|nr:hypothetical protein [Phenylobacterium sp.]
MDHRAIALFHDDSTDAAVREIYGEGETDGTAADDEYWCGLHEVSA